MIDGPAPGAAAPSALRLAAEWPVVRRGLVYAAVVGTILIAINHGEAIVAGELTRRLWLKMGLTMLVPYAVSALSSVRATLDVHRAAAGRGFR